MNEFDQFVKHTLRIKNYVRYTDDFVIVSDSQAYLMELTPVLNSFLHNQLRLTLHPHKTSIRKFSQGIDFLGYVVFPTHRLVRSKTRQRIIRNIRHKLDEYRNGKIVEKKLLQTMQSYRGVLSHADTFELGQKIENMWYE